MWGDCDSQCVDIGSVCVRAHACQCVARVGRSRRRRGRAPPGPSLLRTFLLSPGPCLAAALFANTLSSSRHPLWPQAQSKATTRSWIVCHALPGPCIPRRAPAVATEVLPGAGQTAGVLLWSDPKEPLNPGSSHSAGPLTWTIRVSFLE